MASYNKAGGLSWDLRRLSDDAIVEAAGLNQIPDRQPLCAEDDELVWRDGSSIFTVTNLFLDDFAVEIKVLLRGRGSGIARLREDLVSKDTNQNKFLYLGSCEGWDFDSRKSKI